MKQLAKRLKNKSGETLVESLAAILIFTFASIAMLSMISTAMNINKTVKDADDAYFQSMQIVEKADLADGSTADSTDVEFYINTIKKDSVTVNVYGGGEGGVYAYYKVPQGGSGNG